MILEAILVSITIFITAIVQSKLTSIDSEKTRALLRQQQADAMKAKEENNLQEIDRAYQIGYNKALNELKNGFSFNNKN
jgi:hypothetical protein